MASLDRLEIAQCLEADVRRHMKRIQSGQRLPAPDCIRRLLDHPQTTKPMCRMLLGVYDLSNSRCSNDGDLPRSAKGKEGADLIEDPTKAVVTGNLISSTSKPIRMIQYYGFLMPVFADQKRLWLADPRTPKALRLQGSDDVDMIDYNDSMPHNIQDSDVDMIDYDVDEEVDDDSLNPNQSAVKKQKRDSAFSPDEINTLVNLPFDVIRIILDATRHPPRIGYTPLSDVNRQWRILSTQVMQENVLKIDTDKPELKGASNYHFVLIALLGFVGRRSVIERSKPDLSKLDFKTQFKVNAKGKGTINDPLTYIDSSWLHHTHYRVLVALATCDVDGHYMNCISGLDIDPGYGSNPEIVRTMTMSPNSDLVVRDPLPGATTARNWEVLRVGNTNLEHQVGTLVFPRGGDWLTRRVEYNIGPYILIAKTLDRFLPYYIISDTPCSDSDEDEEVEMASAIPPKCSDITLITGEVFGVDENSTDTVFPSICVQSPAIYLDADLPEEKHDIALKTIATTLSEVHIFFKRACALALGFSASVQVAEIIFRAFRHCLLISSLPSWASMGWGNGINAVFNMSNFRPEQLHPLLTEEVLKAHPILRGARFVSMDYITGSIQWEFLIEEFARELQDAGVDGNVAAAVMKAAAKLIVQGNLQLGSKIH